MNIHRKSLLALLVSSALSGVAVNASAAVAFLGEGSIAGTTTDTSGLTGTLEDGVTPHNLAGGFGSALAYTGNSNLYVATPDRGPADGTTSYQDRLYGIRIAVKKMPNGQYAVSPTLVSTHLLTQNGKDKSGVFTRNFTGNAAAFDSTGSAVDNRNKQAGSLRFDPEGVRMGRCGKSVFISDEYGPYVHEFTRTGSFLRSLNTPTKYLADQPSAVAADELAHNLFGRQSNRGMEGLAISPDGSKLYGIMQSPLIQDGGLDAAFKRVGTNNRILEIDVETGAVREFLYPLADKGNGVSEILAINDHELLVLERDGKAGAEAVTKKIYKIDLTGATDVRGVRSLLAASGIPTEIPAEVTPVGKSEFLDLLNPAYGLAGDSFPEKLEALAFGPDLADGRHLLIVANDNDFNQDQASRIFAFAVDAADLPGFQAQQIDPQDPSCR